MENQIGEIRITRQLSDEIYLGEDTKNRTKVFLRSYLVHLSDREEFMNQCSSLLEFEHPNLIPVLKRLRSSTGVVLAMEYAPGGSLEELLVRKQEHRQKLDVDITIFITMSLLKGLAYIHSKGFCCRGLKPSKILFSADGEVKLADICDAFLIDHHVANLPEPNLSGYEPPEVLLHGLVSPQSDIYSVGEILYQMLTGVPPYQQNSVDSLYSRIGFGEFTMPHLLTPEIPSDLEAIIMMAMETNPQDRFQSAMAMHTALGSLI